MSNFKFDIDSENFDVEYNFDLVGLNLDIPLTNGDQPLRRLPRALMYVRKSVSEEITKDSEVNQEETKKPDTIIGKHIKETT